MTLLRFFYVVQMILRGNVQFYKYMHVPTHGAPELSTYQGNVTTNSKQNATKTTNTLLGPIETLHRDKFTQERCALLF